MHTKSASTLVNRAQFALAVDDPRKLAKAIKRLDRYLGILCTVSEISEEINTQFPMKLECNYIACPVWFHVPHIAKGYSHSPRIEIDWIHEYNDSWRTNVFKLIEDVQTAAIRLRITWNQTERDRICAMMYKFPSKLAQSAAKSSTCFLEIESAFPNDSVCARSEWRRVYNRIVEDITGSKLSEPYEATQVEAHLSQASIAQLKLMGQLGQSAGLLANPSLFGFQLIDYVEERRFELFDKFWNPIFATIGPPTDVMLGFGLFSQEFERERAKIQAGGMCHYYSRYGKFDSSFDIHSSTLPDDEHIAVYPQMTLLRYDPDNSALPKILLLGVNIVKRRDGCYLELQSTRGRDWIEFAAHFLQCEVEFWEGNPAQRWSWYEPADPWSVSVYNPADHPIRRPHIDPPDLRDPIAEKNLFDTVDAELKTSTALEA